MGAFPGLGAGLVLLAAALAAQFAAGSLLGWLFPGLDVLVSAGLANLAALSSVAAWGFVQAREGPPLRPVAGIGVGFGLALVLTTWGGTVVLGELSNAVMGIFPLSADLARLFNRLEAGDLTISLFTVAVVAPLTEEALFRGLLLRGFARRWGSGAGLVLSSALFALFHANVWQASAAFAAGLFLGWVFLQTRSLIYPMAVHALFNALPIVLGAAGAVVTGYNSPLSSGHADFQPPLWLAAGTLALAGGLWLTKRWAPLSGQAVSDRVAP